MSSPFSQRPPLEAGDVVWLVSPSGPAPEGTVGPAVEWLEAWGLTVRLGEHLLARDTRADYLAGSDAQRAADLTRAWHDPQTAAVMSFRGGYGAMRLIDALDVAELRRTAVRPDGRPKLLTGSSDITALHRAWAHSLAVPTLFCPMVGNTVFRDSEAVRADLRSWLFEPWGGRTVTLGPRVETLRAGRCTGVLEGGNLSLLAAAIGAPEYQPRLDQARAGRRAGILLLEDVTEELYRLDNLLIQMKRAGMLDAAAGIVLGSWEECGELSAIRHLFEEYSADLDVPILWETGHGHDPHAPSIPLGVTAELEAPAEGAPRITVH